MAQEERTGHFSETKNFQNYTSLMRKVRRFYIGSYFDHESAVRFFFGSRRMGYDHVGEIPFTLGFATGNEIFSFLNSPGMSRSKMELFEQYKHAGLLKAKNGRVFEVFDRRIMFPLEDVNGNILGFIGRRLLEKAHIPKWLMQKDSEFLQKRKYLFNLGVARDYIRKRNCVILVEGIFDVLALYKLGFRNVLALLGTNFSPYQARIILRYCRDIILLLDGDKAGRDAATKIKKAGKEFGLRTHNVVLENGDPAKHIFSLTGDRKIKYKIESVFSYLHATGNGG